MQSSYSNHSCLSSCSLICPSGWMKPILRFRREPVCWSWSTELSASAAETQSLNFSRRFISSPNTGPGFYATISPITTVTAYGCSWPVSVCVCRKTPRLNLMIQRIINSLSLNHHFHFFVCYVTHRLVIHWGANAASWSRLIHPNTFMLLKVFLLHFFPPTKDEIN